MSNDLYKPFDRLMLQAALLPFRSIFWKQLWALIMLVYVVTLWPLAMSARELLFIGRRDGLYPTLAVLCASVWIFIIAWRRQDLGGDALFLVGAYLVGKWAIESVAQLRRRGAQVDNGDDGEGESIFAVAGVHNAALTLSIGAMFGLAIWPFALGDIVGPLLAVGCTACIISDIVWNLSARGYRAKERHKQKTTQMRGEMSELARGDSPGRATFQRVEID